MSYPQVERVTSMLRDQQSALPTESVSQVLEQTKEKLALVENQVDEVVARLFNFPRTDQANEKNPRVPSASESILELRSRAIRINETLSTVLEKL